MQRKKACIAVVKGRRRIGKSRLIKEFAKDKVFLPFAGIAPTNTVSAQEQRNSFAGQLSALFNVPTVIYDDWVAVLAALTVQLTHKPTVLLFDEISWMGSQDKTFIPKLKNWWDLVLQDYPNILLVFCGSISTWIEENIINSTAFFGRIALYIDLQELSLAESYAMLRKQGITLSTHDVFKLLSITGGVPWYLEQIEAGQTADENIARLCFRRSGLLVHEFDRIFSDLFEGKGIIYQKIINALCGSMKNLAQLRGDLHYPEGQALGKYLNHLIISGYVTKHYSWSMQTGHIGKQNLYRLSDNYLRFFLKYIEPNLPKIEKNSFADVTLTALPGFKSLMGLQVENLLLNNRAPLLNALDIKPQDVVADNPYLQKAASRRKGCQIDYMIQTQSRNLFICEFKFNTQELKMNVIDDMKEKIKRLSVPKGFGICPVLVHFGDVSDAVHDTRYFFKIIDMSSLLI